MFIIIDPELDHIWRKHPTYTKAKKNEDVGLDIPMSKPVIVPPNAISFKIDLGFKTRPTNGYMLVPRSSISKTSIRLANSIGIIDKNYRGSVMVVVDNLKDEEVILSEGSCYFQIVSFDGKLPGFQIEDVNDETSRGKGGFGSTGAI
jgi:dUTP pyrophosphatase